MEYHYLDSNNQPAGPASLDEIRALARQGRIPADPMVASEGAAEWKPLSAIAAEAEPAAKPAPAKGGSAFSALLLGNLVGASARFIARLLSAGLVETVLRAARAVGQWAVLAGGVLALVYAVVSAIRIESVDAFILGLCLAVAIAVGQFAAMRTLDASDGLIEKTPSRFSSLALLECAGVLAALFSVVVLVYGVAGAIRMGDAGRVIPAVVTAIALASLGAIALHPELAGVKSGEGSAGEEAIGLIAFFLKAMLKLVPLAFALISVLGAVEILVCIFKPDLRFGYGLRRALDFLPVTPTTWPGFFGAAAVVQACLLPLAAYVAFLVANLPLELWRAILALPGKLDALRK